MEKQKDKAAQRAQRKLNKPEISNLDELIEPAESIEPIVPTEPAGETTPTE
jgi:hypothetical protein